MSTDGLTLACGSDQTIRLWNTQTGQLLRTLTDDVTTVALSADGLILVSGGQDHTIKLWGVKE